MRVCIVPEYPMSLMAGGLQVQAKETYSSMVSIGQEAELFHWSEERPLADLYHFVGFPSYMSRIMELVREAGRPYVITMLFGGKPDPATVRRARIRHYLNAHVLRRRERYDAIHGAAAIITITDGDKQAARSIFGLSEERIHVVVNGVADGFFSSSAALWQTQFGPAPLVLCVGAVQPRKNQLLLVEACNQAGLPVVLLGPVLPGQGGYADSVAAAMNENERGF